MSAVTPTRVSTRTSPVYQRPISSTNPPDHPLTRTSPNKVVVKGSPSVLENIKQKAGPALAAVLTTLAKTAQTAQNPSAKPVPEVLPSRGGGYLDPNNSNLWKQSVAEASTQLAGTSADTISDIAKRATEIYQSQGGGYLAALTQATKEKLSTHASNVAKSGLDSFSKYLDRTAKKYLPDVKKLAVDSTGLPEVEDLGKLGLKAGEKVGKYGLVAGEDAGELGLLLA